MITQIKKKFILFPDTKKTYEAPKTVETLQTLKYDGIGKVPRFIILEVN